MEFVEKSKKLSKYAVKIDNTRKDGPQSILGIIDEKNKIIDCLKKQIVGQKLQLNYYLKKIVDDGLITEFKKRCLPTYVDENVRINMAMCKFYRETEQKSPIRNLFEQMFDIEKRLHTTISQQENMVQIIYDIIMKFAKNCIEGNDAELQLKNFLKYFNQFEIFNDLLISTKNVQNDLNSMKVYCNRLVIVEDERNSLVEQIYSKPLDQQACINYVLSMMGDRKILENELRDIKDELQTFMGQIPIELQKNETLAKETNQNNNDKNSIVNDKEKYTREMTKIRVENKDLNNKIRSMQKMLDSKIDMETKVIELEKKCETLKDRCSNIEYQDAKPLEVQAMETKIGKLQEKIFILKTQSMELKALRKDLAYYKSQVELLEKEKRTIERDKVETVNDLSAKLEGNKDVMDLLKKQIQYLLLLLYYMKEDGKNKKTMEEMNRAISIILSDIDILLLKSEDKRDNINLLTNENKNVLTDANDTRKRCERNDTITVKNLNELKLETNETDLKNNNNGSNNNTDDEYDDDDYNNNNINNDKKHMLPTIINNNNIDRNIKMNNDNFNNVLMRNYIKNNNNNNVDIEYGTIEGALANNNNNNNNNLDCETGMNTSLRMFVRKFDEIAQNINRILCNLSDKQEN